MIGIVWRKRQPAPEWDELLRLLNDLGRMLMSIDARLAEAVELLREGDDGD